MPWINFSKLSCLSLNIIAFSESLCAHLCLAFLIPMCLPYYWAFSFWVCTVNKDGMGLGSINPSGLRLYSTCQPWFWDISHIRFDYANCANLIVGKFLVMLQTTTITWHNA